MRPGRGVGFVVQAVAPTDAHAGERRDRATALLASHGPAFLRRARRFSLCADDADDAYQRAAEILLRKAPAIEPHRLVAWMQVVVGREALAVRRARQRALGTEPPRPPQEDPLERIAGEAPGPLELLERRHRLARATRLLARLKPQERRALVLQAQGYSYAEIQAITGWTYTKTNRCLAEGRARLRQLGVLLD
jgi:RNA polymerase sigma factor (sigma-70 family)